MLAIIIKIKGKSKNILDNAIVMQLQRSNAIVLTQFEFKIEIL